MKVSVRHILKKSEEQVVLECVEMIGEFEDIREYALMKGNIINGYLNDTVYQLRLEDVLYFEAVGADVFAYTKDEVYMVKGRLYELDALYSERKFMRCSKSLLVNMLMIESFRPALNSRYMIRMRNGEDLIVSRMYAKQVKQRVMGEG